MQTSLATEYYHRLKVAHANDSKLLAWITRLQEYERQYRKNKRFVLCGEFQLQLQPGINKIGIWEKLEYDPEAQKAEGVTNDPTLYMRIAITGQETDVNGYFVIHTYAWQGSPNPPQGTSDWTSLPTSGNPQKEIVSLVSVVIAFEVASLLASLASPDTFEVRKRKLFAKV